MTVARRAVLPLRVLLAVMFLVLVFLQVVGLPGQFRYMAEQDPGAAPYRWPLTAVTVFWVLCVQVVVVATWQLLGLVRDDRIFSEASFRWVDAIVAAVGAAWVVLGFGSLALALRFEDPGNAILVFLVDVVATVFLLLLVVMRSLLHQAAALSSDLESVI